MSAKFAFSQLDNKIRKLMVEEIQTAHKNNELYFSSRFNESGIAQWPQLLSDAAQNHDEHKLAYELEHSAGMKDLEMKAKPNGGYTVAHVPDTAAETMADGQFNRFYIAAICRAATEMGKEDVTVYRAKLRSEPRAESRVLEGTSRKAQELLRQVRSRDQSLKCDLLKPNSGLSVSFQP